MSETTLSSGATGHGILYKVMRVIRGAVTYYRHRQTLHELSSLDDHLLQDIGIERAALTASAGGAERKDFFFPRHRIG